MAKINVQFENGSSKVSLELESSDLDKVREAITNAMNLVLTPAFKRFEIALANPSPERVKCIKAIREVTKLGLREAKDFNDQLEQGGFKKLPVIIEDHQLDAAKNALLGFFTVQVIERI
jgi:ribosomal protein L7/L12